MFSYVTIHQLSNACTIYITNLIQLFRHIALGWENVACFNVEGASRSSCSSGVWRENNEVVWGALITKCTGQAAATAVVNLIQEQNLTDRIKFTCFDTTASNTGVNAGAYILLKEKLGRKLISLTCRHHIIELMVAKMFDTASGPSSGPNVTLFQRFHEFWASVDQFTHENGLDVEFIVSTFNRVKGDFIRFIRIN